jgi:hypothetical protein
MNSFITKSIKMISCIPWNIECVPKCRHKIHTPGNHAKERIQLIIFIDFVMKLFVSQFTYLGCSISYQFSNDVEFKLAKFLQLIGNIKITFFKESKNGNYFENIQHFSFAYIFIWIRKLDSDSFTETKN